MKSDRELINLCEGSWDDNSVGHQWVGGRSPDSAKATSDSLKVEEAIIDIDDIIQYVQSTPVDFFDFDHLKYKLVQLKNALEG
jgi:hypothetical protein